MKKTLLTTLTLAFVMAFANAQQMSYFVNMIGSPGQQFIMAQDTIIDLTDIDLNMSDTGAGIVWNFQNLDANEYDTIFFESLSTQEALDFPNGNIVLNSNFGRVVFEKNASTGFYLHGAALSLGGNSVSLKYVPAQRTLPNICSLHTIDSTFSIVNNAFYVGIDTTIFTCVINIDSMRIKRTSNYNVHFDATGELRLPLDTFAYTLKAISSEVTVDSIFIYSATGINPMLCFGMSAPIGWSLAPDQLIALSGIADSAVTHNIARTATWYNPYTISPICIVDLEYDSGFIDTTFLSVRYKGNNTSHIGIETINIIPVSIYPNPASTFLMLQTNTDISQATMQIYNVQGQLVHAVNMNGTNKVDVQALANGMYFYQLTDDKKLLNQGKFIIKK